MAVVSEDSGGRRRGHVKCIYNSTLAFAEMAVIPFRSRSRSVH